MKEIVALGSWDLVVAAVEAMVAEDLAQVRGGENPCAVWVHGELAFAAGLTKPLTIHFDPSNCWIVLVLRLASHELWILSGNCHRHDLLTAID